MLGLDHVAVVIRHDGHLQVKAAEPHKADDVVQAHIRPARLQPRNGRPALASTGGEIGLFQPRSLAGFVYEVVAKGPHVGGTVADSLAHGSRLA